MDGEELGKQKQQRSFLLCRTDESNFGRKLITLKETCKQVKELTV